jgi:hypothetical protein
MISHPFATQVRIETYQLNTFLVRYNNDTKIELKNNIFKYPVFCEKLLKGIDIKIIKLMNM